MDIDKQLAEVARMREDKRQIVAAQALWQLLWVLQESGPVSEEAVEQAVAALTHAAREPLEERVAFQQQEIAHLRQQVEYLTKRVTGQLWP